MDDGRYVVEPLVCFSVLFCAGAVGGGWVMVIMMTGYTIIDTIIDTHLLM